MLFLSKRVFNCLKTFLADDVLDFAKMKEKLTSMSKKVDEKIEDTTEEDAKQAITELKRLETNLQQTKKNVEAHIAK